MDETNRGNMHRGCSVRKLDRIVVFFHIFLCFYLPNPLLHLERRSEVYFFCLRPLRQPCPTHGASFYLLLSCPAM